MSKGDYFALAVQKAFYVPPALSEQEALQFLHEQAIRDAKLRKEMFPDGSDFSQEIAATDEYREAVRLFSKVYRDNPTAKKIIREAPDGGNGGLMAWAAPDWYLVLYCAKLIRYIALCGLYEMQAFTKEERMHRDEREKRHKALMEKWPVIRDPLAA